MKPSHSANNTAAAHGGDNSTAGASAGRGTATAESIPLLSTSTGSGDSTQQQQTMPPPPASTATPTMNVPPILPPGYGTNAGPQSPQYNPYLHPANQAFLQQLQQQQQQQNFQQSPVQFNTTPENQAALAAAAAQYYAAAQAAAHAQQVQAGGGGPGAAGGGVGPSFYPYPFPPMGFQPQQFPPPPQQQYQQQQQQQQQQPPSSPKPPLRGTVSQQPKQKNTASSSSSRRKANNSDIPTNVQITTSASADGSGLPSLQDIFSDQQPQQQQAVSGFGETYMAPLGGSDGSGSDGGGGRGRGYGSMSTGQQQQQQQPLPTAVYNAPPPVAGSSAPPRAPSNSRRSKSPHGRFAGRSGGGSNSNSSGGILVRTGSSGELKLSADTGASSTLSPKSSKNDRHRRVYSDTPLKGLYGKTRHRRAGSDNVSFAPLPKPSVVGSNDSARARTFSNSSTSSLPKPRHRRGDSASSYLSLVSTGDASMVSHRSNIAQSTMFGGIDAKTGKPLLHFPYEAIRLIMIPSQNGFGATSAKKADISDTVARRWSTSRNSYTLNKVNNDTMGYGTLSSPEKEAAAAAGELERLYASGDILPTLLTSGHLYAELPENVNELYEEYHRVSEEMELGLLDEWDDHDATKGNPKNKGVWSGGAGGNSSSNKRPNPLPPANYAMAVDDDVYRRMFSEVSGARTMPCGLFFCGHHEDVAYPSIWIATTLVAALFATLSYLAFYTDSFVDN
mmetsp:Transcript_20959/g.49780  ORF Transcript_20959/g.49780 Transcript_20959/m.49780 type:complete len:730 (-) Transcript_20959:71-2260(-)